MLVSDVARQLRKRLGDPGGVVFKDADIIDWCNAAQLDIARKTETFSSTSFSASAGGSLPITIPTNGIAVTKVFYNVPASGIGGSPLVFTTEEDLLAKNIDLSYQGTPEFYYVPNNGNGVYMYPYPLATDTSDVIIYYTCLPATLTVVSNPLSVKEAYQQDVVTFCCIRAHEVNENYVAANQLRQEYLDGVGQSRYEAMSGDDGYSVVRDDPGDMDAYYMAGW